MRTANGSSMRAHESGWEQPNITTAGKFIFVCCKRWILLLMPFLLLFLPAFFSPHLIIHWLCKNVFHLQYASERNVFFRSSVPFYVSWFFFFHTFRFLHCYFVLFCLFSFIFRRINFVCARFCSCKTIAFGFANEMQGNECECFTNKNEIR